MLTLLVTSMAVESADKLPLQVPLFKGQTLPAANAKLLKAGWKPVRWQRKDTDPEWSANAQVFFDAGFIGVEDCAGTGNNPCLFRYKNADGACLKMDTTGEVPKRALVYYWDFTCPDSPHQ